MTAPFTGHVNTSAAGFTVSVGSGLLSGISVGGTEGVRVGTGLGLAAGRAVGWTDGLGRAAV